MMSKIPADFILKLSTNFQTSKIIFGRRVSPCAAVRRRMYLSEPHATNRTILVTLTTWYRVIQYKRNNSTNKHTSLQQNFDYIVQFCTAW